jgi:uncharacterized membrane protein YphA (DoxX/SURF4 family)
MKGKVIAYWVTTVLIAFAMGSGGIVDLLRVPDAVAGVTKLGYPAYFLTIIGVWKVLGAAAVLAPRMPLVKEWAYAGILFDLTGAAASHAFSGDSVRFIATPLVLAAIAIASWALRPDSRRLKLPAQ